MQRDARRTGTQMRFVSEVIAVSYLAPSGSRRAGGASRCTHSIDIDTEAVRCFVIRLPFPPRESTIRYQLNRLNIYRARLYISYYFDIYSIRLQFHGRASVNCDKRNCSVFASCKRRISNFCSGFSDKYRLGVVCNETSSAMATHGANNWSYFLSHASAD